MAFNANNSISPGAVIKVIGVGGGGGNAVNTMIRAGVEGVEFVAANTDVQALRLSLPEKKIQLGKDLTKGLGAGADPDVGRDAALEDRHEIQEMLAGADMVFITAGMGGGTGTGGASVVAQIAREMGALTVGVITKPFNFEGKRRRKHADLGIERLRESVDTLIVIPNQRLLQIATPELSMVDAFRLADDVLVNAVKGISDIINIPGTINVDFADVKTVMSSMGMALMGIGRASGQNRSVEAARLAISSPLLEDINIEGATGILINITAGSSVSLMEVNEACSIIQEAAHEDANIIFGAVIDEAMGDDIRVTVIATGFPGDFEESDPLNRPKRHSALYNPSAYQSRFTPSRVQSSTPPVAKPVVHEVPIAPANVPTPTPQFDLSAPADVPAAPTFMETPVSESFVAPTLEAFTPQTTSVLGNEAEDLTRLTFEGISASETIAFEDVPTLAPPAATRQAAVPVFADDLEDGLDVAPVESNVSTPTPSAPLESLFDDDDFSDLLGHESRSISGADHLADAFDLAEKLKNEAPKANAQQSANQQDDDLEIPAFLRGQKPPLSLD